MSEIAYLPWQRVAWDMTIPRLLIHAGRQVGKSVVVAAIARRTDIGNVGVFAANHHMAQALKRMAKEAPNARFMSTFDRDDYIGRTFDTLVFDEPGYMGDAEVARVASLAALAKRILLIGTPPQRKAGEEPGWFERMYRSGEWISLRVPFLSLPRDRWRERFADKEREVLGPKVFATEYEGHFSTSPLPEPKRGEVQ